MVVGRNMFIDEWVEMLYNLIIRLNSQIKIKSLLTLILLYCKWFHQACNAVVVVLISLFP